MSAGSAEGTDTGSAAVISQFSELHVSTFLGICPRFRPKNATRNPWKSWTSWRHSTWRTWNRCLSSGSSLRTHAFGFSEKFCSRSSSTWTCHPITGSALDKEKCTRDWTNNEKHHIYFPVLVILGSRQSITRWKTRSQPLMLKRTWNGSDPVMALACRWTGHSLRYWWQDTV